MNPRVVLSALMLFAAAAGWAYYPPPLASDRDVTKMVRRQETLRRYRDRVIPLGCVVLGLGVLLAAFIRRPLPETDQS